MITPHDTEVIIYGYSKLAAEIAHSLNKDNFNFIIIEPNSEVYNYAIKDNFNDRLFANECYDDDEFVSLGISNPNLKALYCLHNDFNRNLFITLSGRNLNQNISIISLSSNENESKKLKLAGASTTINPHEIAGLKLFRQINKPISTNLLEGILHHENNLEIKEIEIKNNSPLNGLYSKKLHLLEQYQLILLGVNDKEITKEFIFASRGINHKLDVGDIVVLLGKSENIEDFTKYLNSNKQQKDN